MSETARRQRRAVTVIAVAALIVIAAWLRLWRLADLPPGFHFDESFEGLEAWRILTDATYRPIFLSGNFGVPPLNAYANAVTFWIVERLGGEAGPTAMRLTAAFFGVLGVLAVWLLAGEVQRLENRSRRPRLSSLFALWAGATLAVMRWHVHFSRMGIEPILVPLIWAGVMWLLLLGWRSGRWTAFIGTGLLLAAGMYAYQGAWIIPVLFVLAVGHLAWFDRASLFRESEGQQSGAHRLSALWRRRLIGLLVALVCLLLLATPLALFFREQPQLLMMRPTQLAIVGETGSPADTTLVANVWATIKMFGPWNMAGDLDPRRNLPGAPALNFWLALPFVAGLLLSLLRIRHPAYSISLIGLAGLLLPGVVSEYAPHFHRVLGAAAPAALIAAIGFDGLWSSRPMVWRPAWSRLVPPFLAVILLAAGAVTGIRDYFYRWAALPDLFYAFDAGLWEVGTWVQEQPPDQAGYITPRGAEHPTLAFAWRSRTAVPTAFDGRHTFPLHAGENSTPEWYAVIEHEDFRTRLLLPELFPGATIGHEITDGDDQLYARIYVRPAGSLPQRQPAVPMVEKPGDGILLRGYDLVPQPARAGEVLYLQLYWDVETTPRGDWTIFTHVTEKGDPAALRAGHDSRPGLGSLPTDRWQPGWTVLDEYQIPLPDDLAPGEYSLYVGLYGAEAGPLTMGPEGIPLGTVRIE